MLLWLVLLVVLVLDVLGLLLFLDQLRQRNLQCWLPTYLREVPRRRPPAPGEEVHLLLCIADHFEPRGNKALPEAGREMLQRWIQEYPRLYGSFRDSDGRPPRHTFFYPIEDYEAPDLEALAGLCRAGFGEVEVHLHHQDDSAEELRASLLAYKKLLSSRHGLLPRHRLTGEVKYGFVHGNWALDNSLPDSRHCGVNNELDVLRETGCYADFTLPSAPSAAQTRTINSIYYAVDDPVKPKSHDKGIPAGSGPAPENGLLLIQGPLLLDWRRRKLGLLPRLENACLQSSQPPGLERLALWLKARVQLPGRPDWFFVKLHAHGAKPKDVATLLGEPMVRFHEALGEQARQDPHFHYHYVTAREMYNLARAAEAGWTGSVAEALDYELVWSGVPRECGLEAVSKPPERGALAP